MKTQLAPALATHWIANAHHSGGSRRLVVHEPATANVIGEVGVADTTTVDAAISAAHAAFAEWSQRTPLNRARILFRFRDLLERSSEELAALISREHGKTLADARGELTRAIEVVEFACGIPHLQKGEASHNVGRGVDCHSVSSPLGVCLGITPFNFPAMVPAWMFPIALACGNTFILKPSEMAPSCPLRLAELFAEAGGPPGVLSVVNGDAETSRALLADPRIQAVSFVGSTPVARAIYAEASAAGKRVQALGGAKNHLVVMPDANPQAVEDALMGAAFGSAGERCMAISVAVLVGDGHETLVERLVERVRNLRIGPGNAADNPDMGPLVSAAHRDRVRAAIDAGVAEGATLLVDGRRFVAPSGHRDGYFVGGTLFDHVQPTMQLYQREIFGPVLAIVRVPDAEAALELVNGHTFGNGCAIFTSDGGIARMWCDRVQIGMVGVNVPIPVPMAFHCFGGWKQSLFGSLHMHGGDGVRFYTRTKTITTRWINAPSAGSQFTMPTLS
jgi:malonate-semialdehyde dehydrogenase (acetylating) / methylmalonate-semialdehyde dehydrogenase